ncbi:MAG: M20/M25/M40 family metallo-hydrolase, partial [Deltaproteobacteria bacterium]|nr:M20/M25/M40 family metallo-hydrolase [Deltaproteobacteria bacterium]
MTDVSTERDRASLIEGAVAPALAGLEPASMWRHFGALARIPRESGNEEGVREYVKAFAAQRGIVCEVNEVGDVLLRVNPNAAGSVVALQAHMDMVCVSRDGAPFDFAHEPIRLKREGGMVCAEGTSLGADNGIGVAYALAMAEEAKGPMELLFTVDEEQGFTGVQGVAPGWMKAKTLINLDSEEEGSFTIASAGARDFLVQVPGEREAPKGNVKPFELVVDG